MSACGSADRDQHGQGGRSTHQGELGSVGERRGLLTVRALGSPTDELLDRALLALLDVSIADVRRSGSVRNKLGSMSGWRHAELDGERHDRTRRHDLLADDWMDVSLDREEERAYPVT